MGAAQSRELKRSDKVRSKFPNTEVTCKPVTDEDLCFISRLRSWKGNVVEQLMLCPFSPMHCTVDDPLLQLLYSFTLTDPFYPCFDVSCTMPAIERFPTLLVFHDYLKTMYKRNVENPESNINGPNCCSPDAHNIVRSWVLLRIADNVVEQTVASMNNSNNNNSSNSSSGLASSPFAPTPNSGHVSTIKYGFLKCLLTNSNVKPKISVGGYYHSLSTLTELPQGTFADSLGGEAACCGVGTPCADVVAGSQQEQGGPGSPASSPVAPQEVGVDPQATTNSASPAPSSGGSGSAPSSNNQINAVEVGLLQQKYRCDVDITFCLARTFCNEARSATLFHCVTYAERASAKTATKDQVVYPTKVNLRFRKGNLPALRLFAKLYQWHLTTPEGKPAAEVGQNFNIASCDTCQSCNAADPSTKGEDELLCIVVNGPVLTGMLQSAATVCRKGPNGSYTIASFIAQQILPRHSAQQVLGGAGGSAPASPGHPLVDGGRESPLASGQRANSETITSEGEIGTPSPSGSNAGGGAGLSSTTGGGGGLAKSLNLNSSGTASVSGGGKQTLKQNQVVNMEASSCPTPFDALIKLAKVSWSVEDANLGASQSLGGGGSSSMAGLAGLGSSRVQAQLGMIGPPLASPTIVEPYSAVNFLNVSGTNSPTHGSRHGSRQGSRQASRQGSRAGSRQASGQNSPMASHLQYNNNGTSPTGDSTTYLGLPTVSGGRRESQGYGSGPASGNSEGTGYAILSPPPDQMRGVGGGVLGDPYNNSGNSGGHGGSGGGMMSKLSPGGSAMHSANASGLGTPVHSATNAPLMPPTSEEGSSPHQDPYSPNVVPRVKGGGGGMSRGSSFQRGAGGSNSQQGGDSLAGSLRDHSNPHSPHNNQQRQQQQHNNPHMPHPHHQQQQQQNPAPLNTNNVSHQQQWNNQQGGGGASTASYNHPALQHQQQQQTQMMMPQQYPSNNQPQQQFNGNSSNQFQQQRGGNSPYNFNSGNNSRQQYNNTNNGAPQQQQQTGGVMPPPPFHQAPPPHQQPAPPHSPQQNFPITIPDNTPVHASSAGANGPQPQWTPCWWVNQSQRMGGPRVYLQRCAYQPHLADGRVLLELHMDFKSNRQFVPHLPLVDANGQLVSIGGGGNAGQYASTVIAVPVGTNAYQGPSSALAPIM